MSSIIYAGVGGTGPWSDGKYIAENGPDTFVKKLAIDWAYGPGKLYYRGPGVEGLGTNTTIVHQLVTEVMELRGKMKDCRGVVLCGHSRGGAAVIVAARRLMFYGVDIDCLILLDPVNCTPWPESHFIPSNVKQVIKPIRNPFTKSRPLWGNCGSAWNPFTTTMDWDHFYGTHASIGGQVWTADSLMLGYIYEPPEIGPTLVTLADDEACRRDVWNFFYPKMTKICDALMESGEPAAPPPTAIQPPPPSNGSGQKHTVVSGESLSLISGKYWRDVLLWPILWKANKSVVPNPNLIYPGQQLTVPSIAGYSKSQLDQARSEGRHWH